MSAWGFNRESNRSVLGANTAAGYAKGNQPYAEAHHIASKRNVIATNVGWVRRTHKTTHGNARVIDEVLVAAHPGVAGKDYTSNTYLGQPDIAQTYVKLNANGFISANVSANLYVVFNTPVGSRASGNLCSISLANTVSGNHGLAYWSNTATARITNANNTLVFQMPPLQGGGAGSGTATATYKVNAQTISVSGNPVYNPDDGITASANLVITGAVANNLFSGLGARISTFTVRNGG
jgi:hypothetical protein